ncbi:hypothetical protein RPALISO_117 [Ruegeria phage RpAliso]|nr:hypothetical protein RPALISO_117 [Ruegeria phage RpAliso]
MRRGLRALMARKAKEPPAPPPRRSMHPSVERAFEEIDAALFSGDTFHSPDNLKVLENHLARWQRGAASVHQLLNESDEDDEDYED